MVLDRKEVDLDKLSTQISDMVAKDDMLFVLHIIDKLQVNDTVDLLETLPKAVRASILSYLDTSFYRKTILYLPDYLLQEVIDIKGIDVIIDVIKGLKNDDLDDFFIKDVLPEEKTQIIDALSLSQRKFIEEKLNYPKDSAGRLMKTSSLIEVNKSWTVGQVAYYLTKLSHKRVNPFEENIYDVFLVDDNDIPVGTVSLGKILVSDYRKNIFEIKNNHFKTVHTHLDQEEIATIFRDRDVDTIGVIDDQGELAGCIHIDSIIDVIYTENAEDLLLLGGAENPAKTNYSKIFGVAQLRIKWLIFNFIEALTIPYIVSTFQEVIVKHVIITALVQFVIALGGNAGGQSLSVTLQALALKMISPSNFYSKVIRELSVALINGILLGIAGLVWGSIWGDGILIGLIAFAAVWINVIIGTMFGTLFPIFFKKIGVDPAVASAICVTTATDIVGYFLVLLIASSILL